MKFIVHRADTRGYFDHGWLKTYHTFSFAGYYNPERVHFGALRVLNDDTVTPKKDSVCTHITIWKSFQSPYRAF